jgi:chromate reductase, NAD(P)H dehydrogenase (quinone)
MTTIIGLGGSLRRASFNAGLLRAAAALMPSGATLEVHRIDGVPLYDTDVEERDGIPAPVIALKDALAGADALLLVTPEYNNGLPGVLKNAIDWMSRPTADVARVFGGKPVAVAGVSLGGFGTLLAQEAWLPVFRYLKMRPWFGDSLLVSKASALFDEAGDLSDDATCDKLRGFLEKFVASIEKENGAAGED